MVHESQKGERRRTTGALRGRPLPRQRPSASTPAPPVEVSYKLDLSYAARKALVSSLLGVHNWYVRNWLDAIAATLLSFILLAVILYTAIFPFCRASSTCCYPKGVPHTYGSCQNATSDVVKHIGPHPCKAYCAMVGWPMAFVLFCFLFKIRRVADPRYKELAAAHVASVVHKLAKQDSTESDPVKPPRKVSEAWWVFDVWLLGHAATLGGRGGLGMVQFDTWVLFAASHIGMWTVLWPLNTAYGCYPSPAPSTTTDGLCSDHNSSAAKKYALDPPRWWWFYGWAIATGVITIWYICITAYVVRTFASTYERRLRKVARLSPQ